MPLRNQTTINQLELISLLVYFCREICTMLHTLYPHSQALSHPHTTPPQPNPLSHQGLTALTLTKTPACGLMVYFLWMKGLNESAFLPWLWEEAAGCLVSPCQTSVFYIHVPHGRIRLSVWLRVIGRGEQRKPQTRGTRNGVLDNAAHGSERKCCHITWGCFFVNCRPR